ncbi:MAG: hypothetical protein L3J09_00005 [Flavobacteriaceae bacterium]|nr:hypothetical protein [Flavobacteriaceae bacterium]
MKSITFLFSICILLTSCFGYKSIELTSSEITVGKKHQITTVDSTTIDAIIVNVTDNTVSIQKKETQSEIPFSKIKTIKKNKFSFLKSGLLTLTIIIGITAIAFLYQESISIPIGTQNIN